MLGAQGEQEAARWGMPKQRLPPSHKTSLQRAGPTGTGSARSPSPASCSLPNGGSGRAEAGAALSGASYRRAGGRWRVGVCNKHHCRLAELGIIVAKPLRTC